MIDLSNVSIKELVEELENRENVNQVSIGNPSQNYQIKVENNKGRLLIQSGDSGPAKILVITD